MHSMFRGVIASLLTASAIIVADARPPDILLITADDLGVQLGCYGDRIAHTPHLDQLAREGVRFTRGFVTQASCSPSRSSILTGLYPHQNGQLGLSHLGYAMHGADFDNVPRALHALGYATGIIGKLHVQPASAFPFDFRDMHYENARDPEKVTGALDRFFTQVGERPFFMMLNLTDPHVPFRRDVEGSPAKKVELRDLRAFPFMATETADSVRDAMANYYTCVNRADECVGRVLALLEEKGRAKDTLVIFVGDHGPPFPRAKVTLHRAGVHVPYIARWPGTIPAGLTETALVSTIDILPTIMAAAGKNASIELPGRSFLDLWESESPAWRPSLATEFNSHEPGQFLPQRAIEDDRYRLVLSLLHAPGLNLVEQIGSEHPESHFERFSQIPHVALYDLQGDPWETRNLANNAEFDALKTKLFDELHQWRLQTKDPFLNDGELIRQAKIEMESGAEYRKRRESIQP